MRFFVVDLPSLFQRAMAPGAESAERAAALHSGLQRAARGAVGHRSGDEALQAVAQLDGTTLWPTHRIRCYLHGQPPARALRRRARPL